MKHGVLSLFNGTGGLDLGFHRRFEFLGRERRKYRFEIVVVYDNSKKVRCIITVCPLLSNVTCTNHLLHNP